MSKSAGAKRAPIRMCPAAIPNSRNIPSIAKRAMTVSSNGSPEPLASSPKTMAPAAAAMKIVGRKPPNPSAAVSGSIGEVSSLSVSRAFMERESQLILDSGDVSLGHGLATQTQLELCRNGAALFACLRLPLRGLTCGQLGSIEAVDGCEISARRSNPAARAHGKLHFLDFHAGRSWLCSAWALRVHARLHERHDGIGAIFQATIGPSP